MKNSLLAVCSLFFLAIPSDAASVRIVDFGSDLGIGSLFYRGESAKMKIPGKVDRDKDGNLTDEWSSTWEFSEEIPLNAPGLRYDTDQKNAVFYGGLVLYSTNPAKPDKPRGISEGHLNANHEFRDDLNFMGGLEDHGPEEQVEAYATWFWKKENFLNGGKEFPVSFDDSSRIIVHVSRYWGGFNAGRWLVKDGDKFYLSKATFGDSTRQFSLVMEDKKEVESASINPIVHHSQILYPTKTEWAEYHPSEKLDFDAKSANFQPANFKNVTAVGFFVERELSPAQKVATGLRPPFALKWNAFRCDATVSRPPDYYAKMLPLPSAEKPAFFLAKNEISFRTWETVRKISVTNQFPRDLGDLGYSFSRDGQMGSMLADDDSHSPEEPVTGISWLDAIAFCNALSEIENLTPAYYSDPEFKTVLRRVVDRDIRENWNKRPAVYWKKDAPGYRLPTPDELATAATEENKPLLSTKTHPSSASKPNKLGFSDLTGNVWEFAWNDDSAAKNETFTVFGGSYSSSDNSGKSCTGNFPYKPALGSPSIGFRIARNAEPTFVPIPPPTAKLPAWQFDKETVVKPENPLTTEQLATYLRDNLKTLVLPAGMASKAEEFPADELAARNKKISIAQNDRFLKKISEEEAQKIIEENTVNLERPTSPYPLAIGETEMPYKVWKRIVGWAENHGYSFNFSGDIGSMRHALEENFEFSQEEPVTYINWYDVLVACNAMSEILGKQPVFYSDADFKTVYKNALIFRVDTFADESNPVYPWSKNLKKGARIHTGSADKIFFCSTADGVRPLLDIEFQILNKPPEPSKLDEQEWTAKNSGNKTHPTGTKMANANGLKDLTGNVLEWGWDTTTVYHEMQNAPYGLNGNGYFFEEYAKTKPRSPKNPNAYTEFTAVAKPFVGFRFAYKQ